MRLVLGTVFLLATAACGDNVEPEIEGHGPIAEGISAPLGQPWPTSRFHAPWIGWGRLPDTSGDSSARLAEAS